MTILYALLVLLVTVLVTTIKSLYIPVVVKRLELTTQIYSLVKINGASR